MPPHLAMLLTLVQRWSSVHAEPPSRFLTCGEGGGTRVGSSCTTWAILVYDRRDDQPVGDEPYPIKERLMLRGASGQAQGRATEGIDTEGNREEQEKTVAGVAPKAQEKERSHEGGHGNGA